MTDETPSTLEFKRSIKAYLRELSTFAGRLVSESELEPIHEVARIREAVVSLDTKPTRRLTLAFDQRGSPEFSALVSELHSLNPEPVYVWTPRTNACGPFKVQSIQHVNFLFDFGVNDEGIVVLLAAGLGDKMLLDFSEDEPHGRTFEVEVAGEKWSRFKSRVEPTTQR